MVDSVYNFLSCDTNFFIIIFTDCSPPELQERFPQLYLNNTKWPGKASSFEANMSEAYYDYGGKMYGPYARGTFYFTPPQDGMRFEMSSVIANVFFHMMQLFFSG